MSAINSSTSPLVHRSQTARPVRQTPSLPADQFQSAEAHGRGSWGLASTALVLLAGGAALTGCTQAPPVEPIQATTPMPLENPQLMILPEAVPRIDIDRSTSSTTSTDMDGNTTTTESNDPYSPVGTYMGAGIFRDINDNLMFVPQLALGQQVGLTQFQSARLGDSQGRWFASPTLTRQGDGSVTTTRLSPDGFQTDGTSLRTVNGKRTRDEVVRTPNGLEIRDWNRTRYEIKQKGNGVEIYRHGRMTHSLMRQENTIHLQNYNHRPDVITQNGNTITVQEGYGRPQTITQNSHGFSVDYGRRVITTTYSENEIRSDYRGYQPIIHR